MTAQSSPPPFEENLPAVLAKVVSGLAAASARQGAELLGHCDPAALAPALEALQEADPERFFFNWTYPRELTTQALLTQVLGDSAEVRFLYEHHQFVLNHLAHVYSTYEGGPCSVDKAHWAVAALLGHYLHNAAIAPDYTQQYTYHLPRKVLCTQPALLGFFAGLQGLQFGNPTVFLQQMDLVARTARAGRAGPMA